MLQLWEGASISELLNSPTRCCKEVDRSQRQTDLGLGFNSSRAPLLRLCVLKTRCPSD